MGARTDQKRADSIAPGLSVITVIDGAGVGGTVGALVNGGQAHFRSQVKFLGPNSFDERGTIDLGTATLLSSPR